VSDDLFNAVTDVCARIGWPSPLVVARTGSTNADLVGREGSGQVLVALEQTEGKGRLGRTWVSRPGDGLTFSVRLDVPVTVASWGWIPLLTGVAVADAVREAGADEIGLKWPNDVVSGMGKVAGILSQRDQSSVVVGVGINLRFAGERPDPRAVSLDELGADPDADALLARIISNLHGWWTRFCEAAGDARRCGLHTAYVAQCVTLDRHVGVVEAGGSSEGFAVEIDDEGRLVVRNDDGMRSLSAADVSVLG